MLGRQTAQFIAFTTRGYPAAWNGPTLRHPLFVSLRVAGAAAVISTFFGTVIGLLLVRYAGRIVQTVLEAFVHFLIIVPEIVIGVALLLFFSRVGFPRGTATPVAGHTPFGIAVVVLIARSPAVKLDRAIEDALSDLGAGPLGASSWTPSFRNGDWRSVPA